MEAQSNWDTQRKHGSASICLLGALPGQRQRSISDRQQKRRKNITKTNTKEVLLAEKKRAQFTVNVTYRIHRHNNPNTDRKKTKKLFCWLPPYSHASADKRQSSTDDQRITSPAKLNKRLNKRVASNALNLPTTQLSHCSATASIDVRANVL